MAFTRDPEAGREVDNDVGESGSGWLARARDGLRKTWTELTPSEISGALGDLGTFLPLTLGMVKKNGLDLGTTLVFTGAYNVLTGFLFGIPMAVQPMKTIAAVALSERALTAAQIAFAGMAVSFVVILLGVTGLVNHFNRLIPQELIRGTQLGLGVKLAMSGVASVLYTDGDKSEGWLPFAAYDGLLMGSLFFLFVLLSSARNDAADRADSSAKPAPPGGDAGAPGPPTHGCCAVVLHLPSDSTVDRTTPPVPPTTYALERHATHAADARSTGADGKADREGLAEGGEAGDVRREMVVREEGKDRGMSVGSQTMSHGGKETASVTATGSSSGRASWLRLPRRIPAALICMAVGAILSAAYNPSVITSLSPGPSTPPLIVKDLTWPLISDALLRAALPQLPLTTLNSVVSVSDVAAKLFPETPTSAARIATSVGLMNLIGGWFGALPSCHGAGGLAAQARFGAKSGTAPVFLGVVKLAFGLLLGSSLVTWSSGFPATIIGVMLVFAGLELASVASAQRGRTGVWVMLFTAATCMTTNTFWGFVAGSIASVALSMHSRGPRDWWRAVRKAIKGDAADSVSG